MGTVEQDMERIPVATEGEYKTNAKPLKYKTFKDPVYGYISVEEGIVHDIIDTPAFQRLRDIRQTSYAPLYPASLHNRFIHSIGVYHLGHIAFDALRESVRQYKSGGVSPLDTLETLFSESDWQRYRSLFEMACLLHDVGHAPFSHTGEDHYKESKSKVVLHIREQEYQNRIAADLSANEQQAIQEDLKEGKNYDYLWHLFQLTKDPVFVSSASEDPAAHEIMSCIIALETFTAGGNQKYFQNDEEKAFFARCITGLTYIREDKRSALDFTNMSDEKYTAVKKAMLLDCIIQLLHSSVIDVDRLDYIIRDASTIGYESVLIDYQRLLRGIVLVKDGIFAFKVGFHKSAVSIIENVVYAHDNERKWVQSHPTILYDSYLIQESIQAIEQELKDKYDSDSTLFSFDSLTEAGSQFRRKQKELAADDPLTNLHIRFLCDSDLVYLMKNVFFEQNPYSKEYFCRYARRHPIWKSEAEYRSLFDGEVRPMLMRAAEVILGDKRATGIRINSDLLEQIEKDIETSKKETKFNRAKVSIKRKEYCKVLFRLFSNYVDDPDLILLSTSFFKSNFVKGKVQKLMILFSNQNEPSTLDKVSSTLSGPDSSEKFFYLFYYPRQVKKRVDVKAFATNLLQEFRKIEDATAL